MDISKMRLVKISPYASAKVMFDHFPANTYEQMFIEDKADSQDVAMSAGALCLYAATLLTKVHENAPQNIKCEYSERESAFKAMIKSNPKYVSYTEEQVSIMAKDLIFKDIRNSFAHGNFEISYDIYSKKLFFVLWPRRKDFAVNKPIIISKDALFAANRQYVGNLSMKYMFLDKQQLKNIAKNKFGPEFKNFVLPVDMLRLAENYLDNKIKYYEKYKPAESRCLGLYYPLLVSQMTYEQDDYYNMFNKDSSIFSKIALIRNAIAHNGFEFDNKTFDITHIDRDKSTTDSFEKSVKMLRLVRDHKNLVLYTKHMNFSQQSTQRLIDEIKNFFDALFVYGGYEDEMTEE